MSHIMINKNCNLNCLYCFANEFVNKNKDEYIMSKENFIKALQFVKTQDSVLGIIGGEPTIHPQFEELVSIALNDNAIKQVTIFTNGINLDKYESIICHEKIKVLVNLNSPNDIGQIKFDKIISNLDYFVNELNLTNIKLGINMYKPNFDFDYMLKALKRYHFNSVRTSIAVPNNSNSRDFDMIEYFNTMKPRVFEFFHALEKIHVMPSYDCNLMPMCITTDEEKQWLSKFWRYEHSANHRCNITDNPNCKPVVDILPDLTAVRCFGCSEQCKTKIDYFTDVEDLYNYFKMEVDTYSYIIPTHKKCEKCYYRATRRCTGGCLAYKQRKILNAKRMLCEEKIYDRD